MEIAKPLTDEEKIAFLRQSVNEPVVEESIHGDIGIKATTDEVDEFESRPVPPEVKTNDPVAMQQMLRVLNGKRIPYCMVYITHSDNQTPIMNFVTTMGEGGAELVKHVIDQNKERFGK